MSVDQRSLARFLTNTDIDRKAGSTYKVFRVSNGAPGMDSRGSSEHGSPWEAILTNLLELVFDDRTLGRWVVAVPISHA